MTMPYTTSPTGRYLALGDSLVPMSDTVTRIGRSVSADYFLDDSTVSRRHALIIRQDGETVLLNDGSLNGTWHNGRRVERAVLRDGDYIDLGSVQLRYVEEVTSPGGRLPSPLTDGRNGSSTEELIPA
jgi:pSer/pThr/pTyr-binding forkhead associated (FHA) protein